MHIPFVGVVKFKFLAHFPSKVQTLILLFTFLQFYFVISQDSKLLLLLLLLLLDEAFSTIIIF